MLVFEPGSGRYYANIHGCRVSLPRANVTVSRRWSGENIDLDVPSPTLL